MACSARATHWLLDLGHVPVLAGSAPGVDGGTAPMVLARCGRCGLVQLDGALTEAQRGLIATAPTHRTFAGRPDAVRRLCEDAIARWKLRGEGHIVEVGSGTGALLRVFRAWQLPVLGVEPDARLTRYARLRRVPTWCAEFDPATAGRIAGTGVHADLLIISTPLGAATNPAELFAAAATLVRPGGVLTFEVPDVLRIIGRTRFDSLRHTQRMLPSIAQLQRIAAPTGFDVVDLDRIDTADDRLRVWLRRRQPGVASVGHPRLRARLRAEAATAVEHPDTVNAFVRRATLLLEHLRSLLEESADQGAVVAAHAASAAAVTVAAAVGMTRDQVRCAVGPEHTPARRLLPGTDVPVVAPGDAATPRPDLVLALDDLPAALPGWEGVPVYALRDLVDVVHHLTTGHDRHFAR